MATPKRPSVSRKSLSEQKPWEDEMLHEVYAVRDSYAARQEPFVNQTLAQHALALLTRLFRYGRIDHHGAFIKVAQNLVQPLAISPTLWNNMRRRGRRFLKDVAA